MRHAVLKFGQGFRVAFGNTRGQAAQMVIPPGEAEGGPSNWHKSADQWLFVVKGSGVAKVNGRSIRLRPGSLILIEHKERHEIRNTGKQLLRTLNIYVPPAYTRTGNELPRAKPKGASK